MCGLAVRKSARNVSAVSDAPDSKAVQVEWVLRARPIQPFEGAAGGEQFMEIE